MAYYQSGKKETFMIFRNLTSFSKFLGIPFLVLLAFFFVLNQAYAQKIDPKMFKNLKYRHIGPVGNRVTSVVGVPGDPLVYYAGAASGGIWMTEDGGIRWRPIFDKQDVQSIGSLAVAPSDHNVIWAGTGEAFIRSNISIGAGIFKSTDGGKNWKLMGLAKTGRIGRIVIDPNNPDVVLAAAMGHCYGPQEDRGVFRTRDGGETWEKVLFVDENTGCGDLAMDPNNPRILFAGMWQLEIHTWGRESGGPGSGLYKSIDGGTTWKKLEGSGLPESPLGKIALAIAPSDSNRIYALIETGDGVPWKGQETSTGVLWRTDDGGDSWQLMSYDHNLTQRPHYYSRCAVSPDDPDEVYFCAVRFQKTKNGGESFQMAAMVGGDNHDIWIDPTNADRMAVGNDQYVSTSTNRGKSWRGHGLPIAQMYHVAVDNQIPYYVYGNRQDGPSARGPSNSLYGYGGIPLGEWHSVGGSESGFAIPDPVDNHIVWSGNYQGALDRYDERSRTARNVTAWPDYAMGTPAASLKYRFQWTFPIAISPHDHNKVYVGSQHVHMTADGGQSWQVISPDLSMNDEGKLGSSGGLTPDNASVEYACLIFALAESPAEEGVIWAGTNDGLVHVTEDGGENWTNVTKNIPDLPEWGTVSNIEPSRHAAGTAYMTVDFHQMNSRDPYVYKTTDYGKTWKSLSATIPKGVFSYCHWVHEDPARQGLLFLGTENAIYVSFNDGKTWMPLQNNLPHAPVHHMVVQEHFNDLVVGTYGRGFWIMDDITPLQQLTEEVLQSEAHLFKPRHAYRIHSIAGGPRVSARASINYYLKEPSKKPVTITILDEEGKVISTLRGSGRKGINRVNWSLRHPGARATKLRTKPPGNPHVVEEKRFAATWAREGWYPLLSWGSFAGFGGFMVTPGSYTVKLSVGEQECVQTLEVKKDPRSEGTQADIEAQITMQKEVRDNLNTVSDLISQIEWMRKQIYDTKDMLKASGGSEDVIAAIDTFDKKLRSVEDELFQPMIAEGDTKSFRFPQKLYFKLAVFAGDLASSVDFAPNDQQREVHAVLRERVDAQKARFEELLKSDLPAFNAMLRQNDLAGVVVPEIKDEPGSVSFFRF